MAANVQSMAADSQRHAIRSRPTPVVRFDNSGWTVMANTVQSMAVAPDGITSSSSSKPARSGVLTQSGHLDQHVGSISLVNCGDTLDALRPMALFRGPPRRPHAAGGDMGPGRNWRRPIPTSVQGGQIGVPAQGLKEFLRGRGRALRVASSTASVTKAMTTENCWSVVLVPSRPSRSGVTAANDPQQGRWPGLHCRSSLRAEDGLALPWGPSVRQERLKFTPQPCHRTAVGLEQ